MKIKQIINKIKNLFKKHKSYTLREALRLKLPVITIYYPHSLIEINKCNYDTSDVLQKIQDISIIKTQLTLNLKYFPYICMENNVVGLIHYDDNPLNIVIAYLKDKLLDKTSTKILLSYSKNYFITPNKSEATKFLKSLTKQPKKIIKKKSSFFTLNITNATKEIDSYYYFRIKQYKQITFNLFNKIETM